MRGVWLLCTVVLASCESKPHEVYEIPAGYRGWVEIRAQRADCRPLPQSGHEVRFVISIDGKLCTSSPVAFGLGREDFYYIKDGRRLHLRDSDVDADNMIWHKEYYGSGGVGPNYERNRDRIRFFIGTKTDYERARHTSRNQHGLP